MNNKKKTELTKTQIGHNFWMSLSGYLISILISVILAGVVWFQRRGDNFSLLTSWSNFFVIPGVWNLVFGSFWLMTRYGFGNNLKFIALKRSNKKKRKHGIEVEKNIPNSPFEYDRYHKEKLNPTKFGVWLTIGTGIILVVLGTILAVL